MTGRTLPLVGVTTYAVEAAFGPWRRPSAVLAEEYYELVAQAGGRPVLLPPVRRAPGGPEAGAAEVVDALDALVLVGGGDVDPDRWGGPAHGANYGVDPGRDAAEAALLGAALAAGRPVLAICRGIQVLNVLRGGTLVPHLPDHLGHARHQEIPGVFEDVEVATEPGTALARILGPRATVRCSHHQAVDRPGRGLVVAARAVDDPEVVEAVELPEHPFCLGVQWHPEESDDVRLFAALVDASR